MSLPFPPSPQAQQGGELVQLQDDASYALDGLSPGGSLVTQRESAAALAEVLATRKGRLALRCGAAGQAGQAMRPGWAAARRRRRGPSRWGGGRLPCLNEPAQPPTHHRRAVCAAIPTPQPPTSPPQLPRKDGLAQQVLSALAKLKVGRDPVLALAGSCVLLALAQDDAHPAYMASTAAAVLADQLLQVGRAGGGPRVGRWLVSLATVAGSLSHGKPCRRSLTPLSRLPNAPVTNPPHPPPQEPHTVEAAVSESPCGARLQRLLHNGSLLRAPGPTTPGGGGGGGGGGVGAGAAPPGGPARARHAALAASPRGLLLAALAAASGAHDAGRLQYTEVLRAKMLRHGLLARLAGLVPALAAGAGAGGEAAAGALPLPSPSRRCGGGGKSGGAAAAGNAAAAVLGPDAWLLAMALRVLENATFTSPENAACLAAARCGGGGGGGGGDGTDANGAEDAGGGRPLPAVLIALLRPLCAATLAGGGGGGRSDGGAGGEGGGGEGAAAAQCLHGALALLINLTHGTTDGGACAVAEAGGARAVAALLEQLLPGWERAGPGALRTQVWGDELPQAIPVRDPAG
jgi:hypothetical protein